MGRKHGVGLVPVELWRPLFVRGRRGDYPLEYVQAALHVYGEAEPSQAKVAEMWKRFAPELFKAQDKEKADE